MTSALLVPGQDKFKVRRIVNGVEDGQNSTLKKGASAQTVSWAV